ncbi:hypothetical protein RHGRI_029824 [Rhododendron griersonianum]|uniref:C3H1-type domain-containing protein n=1 Tax=Rhododendron griersonianum TaxID=479676 RepID=A0AAV6ILB2_9ERIC|nr:hypothetical protein RHGRI_029824 [Rhododendron griersonianum]
MVTGVGNLQGNLFVITNHKPGNIPHSLLVLLIRNAMVLNPVTKVAENFQMTHWHGIEMEVTAQKCHLVLRTGGNNTTVTPLELVWADHTGVGTRTGVRQVVLAGNQDCMEEIMQLKIVEILLPVDAGEVIIAHIFIKVTESTRIGDVLIRVGQMAGKVETRGMIGGSTCRVWADLMISAVILLRCGRCYKGKSCRIAHNDASSKDSGKEVFLGRENPKMSGSRHAYFHQSRSQDDWRRPSRDSDVVKQTGEHLKEERRNSAGPSKEQSPAHCLPLASSSLGQTIVISTNRHDERCFHPF